MRKCENCNEFTKDCKRGKTPVCSLRLPIIWQLLDPRKIGNFEKCLRSLHMKIEVVGNDDFKIVEVL
jgi:hypothetical protein